MKRHVYFSMKPLEEAREIFFSRFGPERRTRPEEVTVEAALGRVTAEPVFARFSVPSFHAAAMDGIAVRAESTYGTTERAPRFLRLEEEAVWVNTGQALPDPFDAVIMVEKIHEADAHRVEIRAPAYPWQHVRKVGEDIVATQLLFPKDHRIRAYDLGALIAAGVFNLLVWERPRVAIVPTGSELVHYRELEGGSPPEKPRIVEFNAQVLAGLVKENGGEAEVYSIVPDVIEAIREAVLEAVGSGADIIVVNAGSSAGSRDYTAHVLSDLGEVMVHGVAMMPGKPTILGVVQDRPVVGNPGYAVSSVLCFEQFVKPLLYTLRGLDPPRRQTLRVMPTRDMASKLGIEEFVRVSIGKVGERFVATPLPRAAGSITTLTRAEGIVRVPALAEGINRNEEVEAELLVEPAALLQTVVIVGSHDMTLDILADQLREEGHRVRVSSANVGSLGGLMALRQGSCHMAGSHLLDPETLQYNLPYVQRYLKGMPVSIFHLVQREQGLMVRKGNPKGIRGLEDLAREDVTFINRQAGSGTRVLLDYRLRNLGIDPASVRGYLHEEFTHMAVAVAVQSGAADCGLGIYAAAKALDLDFIPLELEQYDLVVPTRLLDEGPVRAVLESIRSEGFRARVRAMGGYRVDQSGELWQETGGAA